MRSEKPAKTVELIRMQCPTINEEWASGSRIQDRRNEFKVAALAETNESVLGAATRVLASKYRSHARNTREVSDALAENAGAEDDVIKADKLVRRVLGVGSPMRNGR